MGHHGNNRRGGPGGFGGGRSRGGRPGGRPGGFLSQRNTFRRPRIGLPFLRPRPWYHAPWGGWTLTETAMLLLFGAAAIKISQSDADRIRSYTGRDLNTLTEAELAEAMRQLGIRQMTLSDDESEIVMSHTSNEKSKSNDAVDLLRELKRLRDEDILSEEEYQARKDKIVDDMIG